MSETLYAVMTNGDVQIIPDVTAFDIDNTITIKPGDSYEDNYIEQSDGTLSVGTPLLVTTLKGDVTSTGQAQRDESWLCTHWKFTRGASLPPIWLPWINVEGVGSSYPDIEVSSALAAQTIYVTLRSGIVLPITGIKITSGNGIVLPTNKTIYPGDYWRKEYFSQSDGSLGGGPLLVTNQLGDAVTNTALRAETWGSSHYEFTRPALLSLFIPWANVQGMDPQHFPNRPIA